MTVSELLTDGLELMVIGMTVVFVFLSILVFSITMMSKLAKLFETPAATPDGSAAQPQPVSDEIKAVIDATVARYRKDHNQ